MAHRPNARTRAAGATALAAACAALSFAAGAAAEIADIPLSIANTAEPNILVVVDDSGSMDFETLFETNDGALWWNTSTQSFWGAGSGRNGAPGFNYNESGNANSTWKKYAYLFPNGSGSGNRNLTDGNHDHFAVPPTPEFAFARSPDYNRAFYNPAVTYLPWTDEGGYTFNDAVASSVSSDPLLGGSSINLAADLTNSSGNWTFKVHAGMRRPDGTVHSSTTAANGTYTYYPATYWMKVTGNTALPWRSATCNSPDPLVYGDFRANPGGLSAVTGVDAIAPDGACLRRFEIKSGNSFPSGRSYADELQNFANWFAYHRKRDLALRAGMGASFTQLGGARVGAFTINNRNTVTMWDMDTQRSDLIQFVYNVGSSGGTPNREALDHAGKQFDTNGSIVQYACQQNFALQFTDGFSTLWTGAGVGNADGDDGLPFADGYSNTLADIAMRYYEDGVRADLADGKVPVPPMCMTPSPPGWLDCNRDPHMVHFGITLGGSGDIYGVTHFNREDAHSNPPAWQDPNLSRSPVQIDDLYHATVNGRGRMLNARSTDELTTKLSEALRGILEQVVSSASVVASNSTRLDTDTLIYQARFDSSNWSGQLLAVGVNSDGTLGSIAWDAADKVPAPASRSIYTRTGAGAVVEFQWANLDAAQQAALNTHPTTGAADGRGPDRMAWLRGERGNEQINGGTLRSRGKVLGDIVNSSPWFVGGQSYGYELLPSGAPGKATYSDYVLANRNTRPKTLYVGANDGMVHAFDAETGIERFAYVPRAVVNRLNRLTDPLYSHEYYVDGSPVAGDAYIGSSWKTYLVGSLGAGGRAVYALDVTNPSALGASTAKWEFTDTLLGHVIGRPSIARMANGQWAAIFGSGYGLDKAARLFIVDLATGNLVKVISTVRPQDESSAAANGLSSPFPVDFDGDAITDFVYAGDLYGNMWKFDVRGANVATWDVSFKQGTSPRPLFTACASGDASGPFACPAASRQPITMRPVVGRAKTDGLMVYFGTGKFFETGDNVVGTGPRETYYGVHDRNTLSGSNAGDRVAGRSELVEQRITHEVTANGSNFRVITANPATNVSRGWYMDLVSPVAGYQGERAVSQPLLREGRLIFTTLIPNSDPCESGGTSWLMEFDAVSGGRIDPPIFDSNNDGVVDEGDYITVDGQPVAPSGRQSEVGIIDTPTIIEGCGEGVECKYASGSSSNIEVVRERERASKGRNSWRQRWPEN